VRGRGKPLSYAHNGLFSRKTIILQHAIFISSKGGAGTAQYFRMEPIKILA
jgi:hypothetical protein